MQNQLEALEEEYGIVWREYKLEEIFGKSSRGRRLKSADRVNGHLPFVTAGETNMGISAWIANDVHIYQANTVTIDMFGSAKYRNYEYGADDHVAVVHTESWPKYAALYLSSAIHKSAHAGQFDYSRNFYASDADELNVSLPITLENGSPEIAIEFMVNFIDILNQERLVGLESERKVTLNAYLRATDLNDYILNDEERIALESIDTVFWGEFKVGDLFDIRPTKNYGLSNKDLLTSLGDVPVVSNTSTNNGITAYVDLKPTEKGNVITFSDTTTDEAIFYQPYDFVGYSHIQAMHKKFDEEIGKYHYLFFVTAFKNAVKGKYNYGSKFNRDNAAKEKIKLPVKPDHTPNFKYMSLVVTAMQKVVIKNLADYLQLRIQKTEDLLM